MTHLKKTFGLDFEARMLEVLGQVTDKAFQADAKGSQQANNSLYFGALQLTEALTFRRISLFS